MGTRGLYGFRKNGEDKLTYNHWDSYPDCLGDTMVKFCKETSVEEMNEIFDRIVLVYEKDTPTDEQIAECVKYFNDSVGSQAVDDWYCLIRDGQGNPDVYKNGLRYMIDNHGFINDSLFCEYVYIINLDNNTLEFYIGFQKAPDVNNRYGTEKEDGYYPCKMVAAYPIEDMEKHSIKYYVNDMNRIK